MKGEPDENKLPDRLFQKCRSHEIERDHIKGMQVMKTDAAPPGMKNRICQQMIQVHSHGRQQDKPGFFPVLSVIEVGDKANDQEVEGIMDDCLQQENEGLKGQS